MVKHRVIQLFRGYHKISHLFWATLPLPVSSGCRFEPTCSEYSTLAVERYGVFHGLLKSILRVARCNPLSPAQVDIP